MRRLRWALRRALFPKYCFLCHRAILPHQRYCGECAINAPWIEPPLCERCGRGQTRCTCKGHRRHFERCISPFYYQGMVKRGVRTLKSADYAVTVDAFTAEMEELVRREYGGIDFDMVTSVPLHPADRRHRGFDQAARLGVSLASRLEIPYAAILRKLYRTRPQKELPSVQRSGNLLGVFDVTLPIVDKRVLLVDDLITTGATLDECAKMLKLFGAAEVYAVTAAAAVLQKDE